ncbi:UNVERIFIED_CONTAM: hypothetical protein Sindi_2527100 [Sesamum indicum]
MAILVLAGAVTPLDVDVPKGKGERVCPTPAPPVVRGQGPPHKLNRMSSSEYQIAGVPSEEQQDIPFSEEILADKLPTQLKEPNLLEYDGTMDPQEHLSYFENVAL